MKTALCFFGKDIYDLYENNEKIFFLNSNGCHFFENKKMTFFSYEEEIDSLDHGKFDFVIDELKNQLPTISRWNSRGDTYNILLRDLAQTVLIISYVLKKNNIKQCVVSTSLNHHIDSTLLDIAGRISLIPRIYLYVLNVSNRLLPFKQLNDFKSREILDFEVSNHSLKKDLDFFVERASNGLAPIVGGQFLKTDTFNIFKAILLSVKNDLAFFYRKIKSNKKFNNEDFFEKFNQKFPFQNLIQTFSQNQGIYYYKKNVVKKYSKNKIIIMAHFQPEASSFPLGGKRYSHIDIIYKLRSLGYKDLIYYKEHPASNIYFSSIGNTQVGSWKTKSYYKHLKKLGCVFLDIDKNKNLSMSTDFIPITISGTIAMERAFNGLHTIVSGDIWYLKMPGVIHLDQITDFESLNKSLFEVNPSIAKDAYLFFKNTTKNKTLINATGIGLDGKLKPTNLDVFKSELDKILNI